MRPLKVLIDSKPADLIVLGAFGGSKSPDLSRWKAGFQKSFSQLGYKDQFDGSKDSTFFFDGAGVRLLACGLGGAGEYDAEVLRRTVAGAVKRVQNSLAAMAFDVETFLLDGPEKTVRVITEACLMAGYRFSKYQSEDKRKLKQIFLQTKNSPKSKKALEESVVIAEAVNTCRSLINEPPNVLNSTAYAKAVEKDIQNTKNVDLEILGLSDLKKEKMGLFLSVNAGSAHPPQLVCLTYAPPKPRRHVALVGKGLTFDTGGYSIKSAQSMVKMKFDMGGSATVYAAFKACAQLGWPVKVSCFLGITDNAINAKATMPDSIVRARNGKTVEILNTDAEGRLVLGDCLDYACEQKPDLIVDCATLTGACLVALGTEVCGLMGNNDSLKKELLQAAESADEHMWELPIIAEWRKDMKSKIADLKNIGSSRFAGTAKAAAFLEEFIKDDIPWAHLDIAGISDSQKHLPYCPEEGGSGLIVRSLIEFLRGQANLP